MTPCTLLSLLNHFIIMCDHNTPHTRNHVMYEEKRNKAILKIFTHLAKTKFLYLMNQQRIKCCTLTHKLTTNVSYFDSLLISLKKDGTLAKQNCMTILFSPSAFPQ